MKQLTEKIQAKFNKICKTGKLFESNIPGDKLWGLYLSAFENDPIFRDPESSEHNCKLCNNFIRRYGNIVSIDENYNITTMFDIIAEDDNEVHLQLSTEKVEGSDLLKFMYLATDWENGAFYHMSEYKEFKFNLKIWLCNVTKFVFGEFPKNIYIKKY